LGAPDGAAEAGAEEQASGEAEDDGLRGGGDGQRSEYAEYGSGQGGEVDEYGGEGAEDEPALHQVPLWQEQRS
jgi:hypothetical protein